MSQKRKKRLGIKFKLLCTLVPAVLVILAGSLLIVYRNTSQLLTEQGEELLKANSERIGNEIRDWMNQILIAMATERDVLESLQLTPEEELDYIRHTAGQYDSFPSGLYLGTTKGELIHSSFVPDASFDIFSKPWYQDGLSARKIVFGSAYYDEDSKNYVVGASGQLKDRNGTLRGVVAADIYLNAISQIVEQVTLEETGGMFLIDSNTRIIIGHKSPELVGTFLDEQSNGLYSYTAELLRNESSGLTSYTDEEGNEIYLYLGRLENSNFVTVAFVPKAEVLKELNSLTRKVIGIAGAGILLLLILMERLIHLVVRPVKQLRNALSSMTNGDFTSELSVRSSDEIGHMAQDLKTFSAAMKDTIRQITQISVTLNSESLRGAEVAKELSSASNLQSNSMEEMKVTMQELARAIAEVAENASELANLAKETTEQGKNVSQKMEDAVSVSDTGRGEMQKVTDSMEQLNRILEHLVDSVKQEGASIDKINSIVSMIREISEETNLLSLNASIEAARAGEAGKGFVVVAEQIRKLADTSKGAVEEISLLTKEISELITQTVQNTTDSSGAIQNSLAMVRQAFDNFTSIYSAVNDAGTSVATMVDKIIDVNNIATSVAGITEEQSAASEEILSATETLRSNAENVDDYSQTVASNSNTLEQSSQKLNEQMNQFKI